ncbi:MAG: hypothetical protein R3C14_37905 [Caldilineaceae bacterium]
MKFPYGVSDFYKIITRNEVYIDRTDRIPVLEDVGDNVVAKLKLHSYAVVAVGFERLLWEEVIG